MADEPDPQIESEEERVYRWRFAAAKHAGLNFDDASAFAAGDGDIALLRSMEEHGATVALIVKTMV